MITIQIDFQLAERFGMTYVDADGQTKYPYVIHRTSLRLLRAYLGFADRKVCRCVAHVADAGAGADFAA